MLAPETVHPTTTSQTTTATSPSTQVLPTASLTSTIAELTFPKTTETAQYHLQI